MKTAVALLVAAAAFALPAAAQEISKTITISETQAAQLLILNNRLDDARRVLEHVLAAKPDDS